MTDRAATTAATSDTPTRPRPPGGTIGEVVDRRDGTHQGWIVAPSDKAYVARVRRTIDPNGGPGGLAVMLAGTDLPEGTLVAILEVIP